MIALLGLLVSPLAGQAQTQAPLLDRELFFGDPEISGAQLSPDGQYISFIKPFKGTRNVWVKKAGEPFAAAKVLTADTKRPVTQYFWARDSKYVLYVQDQGGDENYNVYAVDPSAAPAAGADVPAARNITDAKGARARIFDVPKNEPGILYVGLNDRDKAWHDLYRLEIATGKRTLMRQNTEKIAGWVFDNAGTLRLAARTTDAGSTEILRVDDKGFTPVYTCSVFESCGPVHFHKDGQRVYLETSKGEGDLSRLTLFDPASGKEELVESDPAKKVDFGAAHFSEVTDELVATTYLDDKPRWYFRDKALEADFRLLEKKLTGRTVNLGSSTADEQMFIVSATSDVEPGETFVFDRKTKQLTSQYKIREKLPREALSPMSPVHYTSSDGLEIPAYLTVPKGTSGKNMPAIVVPHGGPWARDDWGYDGIAQFLSNRGYVVLQPNFRGSTGFGKKFLNAGNKQWGDLMQDDLSWGVKYLVAKGIADPKRVGILGGSYGGYATLAGLAFTPDVYAAGVSIVGPSNIITLLDSIPPYWEAVRTVFNERLGNPNTPEGRKQLERQSPINSANKITTPLLVLQGANDPRVKQAESDQIVIALRDRGFPVEYIVAPDEGHGFARPVNNMAGFATIEKFLAKYLGGRAQESMTPEVATRLKEITVDPKTVVLTKKVDTAAVGTPKPAVDLTPSTANFKATIAVNGQTIPMDITSTVKDENGAWVASETAKTPMGDMVDTATLEKGTLIVKKRSVSQGPVVIELAFEGNKATGTMTMNGQSKPIDAELGGALFADGAGTHNVIASLPLAEGYTATFRNFNVQSQKVALKQVKVLGVEDVTVPAGTFKAWKVEESSAEGEPGATTIWVATDSRKVVKITATLPQMGGAVLTSESQ
ncbi:MAG: prolyl oligopeptidase family serine peptidase [Vicinamibacteria bacterium]|nr:prolyl oligopeptidase family serine peptidase [Vicinamibacteria bacterium]